MITKKSILRAHLYALSMAALLFFAAAPARAQHEGHDMSNMPGMSKPKPKSKSTAARKRQPKKRTATGRVNASSRSKKTPARKTGTDGTGTAAAPSETTPAQPVHVPGHTNMTGAGHTPSPAPSPSPQASPSSDQGADTSTHGTHTTHDPVASPSPQTPATPAPSHEMHTTAPTPTAEPVAAPAHKHTPGMEMPETPAAPAGSQPNPHATHGDMSVTGDTGAAAANDAGHTGHTSGMSMLGMMVGRDGRITSRTGSGTMWQPASTPMPMLHWQKGDWMVMMHADVKLGVNAQGGPRGVTKFESQNWLMAMATRKVGRGTLDLRSMFSLEPLTLSGPGSPQLFQSGESYQGQPIRNAQHPHDLFMTLSASYSVPIGERGSWFAYFGMPGEPALGPVAFMHRASAAENPSAPLSHHLQDSTHISYGVFTTGFTYRWFKVEGSVFNGREPDENRYDIEFNPWNSRSVRVQFAPNKNWAAQVSYGFLKNPEAWPPGTSAARRLRSATTSSSSAATGLRPSSGGATARVTARSRRS